MFITLSAKVMVAFAAVGGIITIYRRQPCVSSECIRSAARLLDSMDTSADPCSDFYQFACGGWNKHNPMPESHTSWGHLSRLSDAVVADVRELLQAPDSASEVRPVKQARALYRSCMDTDKMETLGLEPLLHVMRRLGLSRHSGQPFDLEWTLGRARGILGLDTLIKLLIKESDDTSIITLDQISPGMQEKYLLEPDKFPEEIEAYTIYIREMVAAYREYDVTLSPDDGIRINDTAAFAASVLNFSTQYAQLMRPGGGGHGKVLLTELQEEADDFEPTQFNFSRYLEFAFEETDFTSDFQQESVWYQVNFFPKLSQLLRDTDPVTVERFVWWNVFSNLAPLTVQKFRDLSFLRKQRVKDVGRFQPRWMNCTRFVNTYFEKAISHMFVGAHFDIKTRTKALKMVADVKAAFFAFVMELEWMDEQSKSRTLEKVETMRPFIGLPDGFHQLTPGQLENFYQEDIRSVIREIGNFMDKPLNEVQVSLLADHVAFTSMQSNPAVNYEHMFTVWRKEPGRFMRQGRVGGWKEEMTSQIVKEFDTWTLRCLQGSDYQEHVDA